MAVCASCGQENPSGFRFCGACGSALTDASAPEVEERKTVSVLFVDLVGFTAASEQVDPEDVRSLLKPYHARVKEEIERFGGTVEKFIGDAVMAVFGAPVAHEDDAERSVRAGLRILEAIEELRARGLELAVRAAVNTGEAIVALGARPEQGESIVTGDVVNTAARLQNAAPVGALVVGRSTVEATRSVIEYEPLDPVQAKGKSEPIPLWRATGAISRFGVDILAGTPTPLVGRERELASLVNAYERAVQELIPQLVTIGGEPGIGKSRLVAELAAFVDERAELVSWRQGRCLPYGEGVTYWALGEIVKAQAGILESDDEEATAEKLTAVIATLVSDASECAWLCARLAPLVGVDSGARAEREELFTAWSRFFESLAATAPLVLVFEDLHWADDGLLDFVEHLAEWATEVPLLLVCTARPELYERRPSWGGGIRNSVTISLRSLSADETARLVTELLERHAVPGELVAALLERAGGNPLYTEELIRMLEDRGRLRREGRTLVFSGGDDLALPSGVAALVAARLDTLPLERKALLHDAAVIGKVFWSGAVASMAECDRDSVAEALRELGRKEFVRRARVSSVEGELEYTFWHVVLRDVAYGQIPRRTRATKHLQAARWIEAMAETRLGDHAELLVHHYEQALALSLATGEERLQEEATSALIRALAVAGERALALDAARADRLFRRALELVDEQHRSWPEIARKAAATAELTGRSDESARLCEAAAAASRRHGDRHGEAAALVQLARIMSHIGRSTEARRLADQALALAEDGSASPQLVEAYYTRACILLLAAAFDEALAAAERGMVLAAELDLPIAQTRLLAARGAARLWSGELDGMGDLEALVRRWHELHDWEQAAISLVNLADAHWLTRGPAVALESCSRAVELAERIGATNEAMWARAESLRMLFELGRWNEAASTASELLAWSRGHAVESIELAALTTTAKLDDIVGESSRAERGARELLELAQRVDDDQLRVPALVVAATIEQNLGHDSDAASLLAETAMQPPYWRMHYITEAVRTALRAGGTDLAAGLLADTEPRLARHQIAVEAARAAIAEEEVDFERARDGYLQAADQWRNYGYVLERGWALLGLGRCLRALSREEEGRLALAEARRVLADLDAVALIREPGRLVDRRDARSA